MGTGCKNNLRIVNKELHSSNMSMSMLEGTKHAHILLFPPPTNKYQYVCLVGTKIMILFMKWYKRDI